MDQYKAKLISLDNFGVHFQYQAQVLSVTEMELMGGWTPILFMFVFPDLFYSAISAV
jgi:hypothetical protein